MTVYRRPDPIPLHRGRPEPGFALGHIRPDQEDLHHLVARRIFFAITAGHYPEGSILPTEQALADELGVSRTALREAIKGLASKGLLETRRRRGTLVLPRSRWNMLDADVLDWLRREDSSAVSAELWEIVVSLLPSLAAIAASRGAVASLRSLRLLQGDDTLESRADFLVAIARGAGNRFAFSVISSAIQNMMTRDRAYLDRVSGDLTPTVAGEILARLDLGNTDLLETSLRGQPPGPSPLHVRTSGLPAL